MFLLSVIEDKIKIAPDQFNRDITEAVIEQVEMKFSNRILVDCGLCICFYDLLKAGDPIVYPAEGCCHQAVTFRLVVFRPFVGEIITGKVLSSNLTGIKVTLNFFDDILIPNHLFPTETVFDSSKSQWVWKFIDEDDPSLNSDMPLEVGAKIRFRVRKIEFTDITNTSKGLQTATTSEVGVPIAPASSSSNAPGGDHPLLTRRRSSSLGIAEDDQIRPSAFSITGSINEQGLGMLHWWEAD